MEETNLLQHVLDLFRAPEGDASGWMIRLVALGVGVVLALLLLWWLVRAVGRLVFGRRKARGGDWDHDLTIDLDRCPVPKTSPGPRRLTIYHLPVRLRLVVLAPAGKDGDVDVTAVEKHLDLLLPGLGGLTRHDRPRIRVWPAQVSHQGFNAAFHRHTPKAAGRGELSRWVLVAGRAQLGRQTVMVGLGLWADAPNTLDRLTLEPHQWLDVLRLKSADD
jgi:hypothetical protein